MLFLLQTAPPTPTGRNAREVVQQIAPPGWTDTEVIVVSIIAFVAGVLFQYFFSVYVIPNKHLAHVWRFALRRHERYGKVCPTDQILRRQGFSLGYSYEHRTALWASYVISPGSVSIDMERGEAFFADEEIPEKHRVKPADYTNTGYDKGHLAPSAAIDFSRKSNDETFSMANVALQEPKLNRQAWSSLEDLERKWTFTRGTFAVVTGPIFDKKPKKINNVSVPKAFYKAIYSFDKKLFIGFLFPNEPIVASKLWDHAMSLAELEKKTGYKFFQNLPNRVLKGKSKISLEWWNAKGV